MIEISFKFIHKFYPTNEFINRRFGRDTDVKCYFCHEHTETLTHLFWLRPIVKSLWVSICKFIADSIDKGFILFWRNVLFRLVDSNSHKEKSHITYMSNLIIIMAKLHIHKCKFTHRKPCFTAFYSEFKQYIHSVQHSQNQKAVQTVTACESFHVFL